MNVNSKKKYLDLQSFLLMQEKFWKQKSCDDSIKLGDRNTIHFSHMANRKRRSSAVSALISDQGMRILGGKHIAQQFSTDFE